MDTNGCENAEHGVLPQIVSPLTLLCMKLRLVLEHDSETNRNLRNLRIFHLWDLGSSFLLPLRPGKRTLPDV
jgi:hypothetical protein